MKLNELGFDFSNLSTGLIRRKNTLLGLIMFILVLCFLPLGLVFLGLFIAQVPIEMNGVQTLYGHPDYMMFFRVFLSVMFGLSLLFGFIAVLNFFGKPVIYMYITRDTTNFDTVYYIYDHRKKEEIYLTQDFAVSYQYRYGKTYHESNPTVVSELLDKYVFWKHLEKATDYKVIHKRRHIVVKIKIEQRTRYGARLLRKYTLSNNINIVPVKITETLTTYGGNRNTQSAYTYIFEDVNRSQHFTVHEEIKKVLNDLSQTI